MDKEQLFRARLDEDDVEVPGVGTVRVRALNRAEAMSVQAAEGTEATERRILAFGVIDPPFFDGEPADLPYETRLRNAERDAARWQMASPGGEIEPVTRKIAALSGMGPDSAKQAVREFVANPDAEFPVLPGAEAGDDGGPAQGGDAER